MVIITALIINSAEAAGATIISIPARINSKKTINPDCSCFMFLPSFLSWLPIFICGFCHWSEPLTDPNSHLRRSIKHRVLIYLVQ